VIEFISASGAVIRYFENTGWMQLTNGHTVKIDPQTFWRRLSVLRNTFIENGAEYSIRQSDDLPDHLPDHPNNLDAGA
jgi:hypothetical protein